jgi:putative hemolysin
MAMKRNSCLAALAAIAVFAAPAPALALKNPAAVYCTALGYEYRIEKMKEGDASYCVFSDGQKVDAWQFLQGGVARDKGYCARKGYEQRIVKDPGKCLKFLTDSCAVCVLSDGREIEVTEFMKLNLAETVCGDGVCGIPENHKTCPQDCPSGGSDGYCNAAKDSRCDPDCREGQDPDCPGKENKRDM